MFPFMLTNRWLELSVPQARLLTMFAVLPSHNLYCYSPFL